MFGKGSWKGRIKHRARTWKRKEEPSEKGEDKRRSRMNKDVKINLPR